MGVGIEKESNHWRSAVENAFIQLAFALGNCDRGQRVTDAVQRSNQHLDGAVDGQDQGVSDQSLLTGEAHAGENGEQDHSTGTGSGRGSHGCDECQDHNDRQLEDRHLVAAAACNEEGCNDLHDGSAVHINGHAKGQNEGGDLAVNAQLFGGRVQIQRQSCCAGGGGEAKDNHLEDLSDENEGVELADQADVQGIGDEQIAQQNGLGQNTVCQSRLQVIDAIGGEGAAQEHKDGNRAKLLNSETQEGDHDLADFLTEAVDHAFLTQTQLVHAQAHNNRDEHNAQHCIVDAQGGTDVAGDDVQDHQQRVGTDGPCAGSHTLDMDIEQSRLVEEHCDGTGGNQSDGAGHHEPTDGLGGHAAQGGSFTDLADRHHHRTKHHGDNDQLQCANKQLATDIKQADGTFGVCRSNILEQDLVHENPDSAVCSKVLSGCHEEKARQNAGYHGDQHLNGKFIVVIYTFHRNTLLSPIFFPNKPIYPTPNFFILQYFFAIFLLFYPLRGYLPSIPFPQKEGSVKRRQGRRKQETGRKRAAAPDATPVHPAFGRHQQLRASSGLDLPRIYRL